MRARVSKSVGYNELSFGPYLPIRYVQMAAPSQMWWPPSASVGTVCDGFFCNMVNAVLKIIANSFGILIVCNLCEFSGQLILVEQVDVPGIGLYFIFVYTIIIK